MHTGFDESWVYLENHAPLHIEHTPMALPIHSTLRNFLRKHSSLLLNLLFFLGVSPARLAHLYDNERLGRNP